MAKFFFMNADNFSDMRKEFESQLEQLKLNPQSILRTELLLEEIFWRMVNKGNAAQVNVQVTKNFFGKVQVKLSTKGVPYNPLVEVSDWQDNDEDENYFSMMILNAHRDILNWRHRQNLNIVTINVPGKRGGEKFLIVICVVGGIVCGVLMKETLSPETILFIKENLIVPTQTMFLNALNLLIAPVIFLSIVGGVTNISTGSGTGKIGLKLLGRSLCLMIVAVVFTYGVTWIFFGGDVAHLGMIPADEVEGKEFSTVKFIVDIILSNLVSPIVEDKVLPILFLAMFFGTAVNSLGDKVADFKKLLDNLNEIFFKMLSLLMFFVPPIVFFAMINLALDTAAETVMLISKLLVGELIVAALLVVFCTIFIRQVGKMSPKPFLKKVPELMPKAFATSSSGAVMPDMMKLCTVKLGVAPKISSFAVPLSVTFNTTGSLICIITASVMFLWTYGIELGLHDCVLIAFLAMMFSFGAPDFISITTIVGHFGVPMEIATLLFCIDALSDRLGTCANVFSNMTATLTLARTENLVDEKIYFKS